MRRRAVCRTLSVVFLLGWASTIRLAAQSVQFTPVGSIPAAADLIQAQGDRVYLASAMTVTIFDASNPANWTATKTILLFAPETDSASN